MSTEFPDFVGVIHKHNFIEIVYVVSGEGTHVVGNHRSKVSKGDLFIINYDTPHAFFSDKNAQEPFVAYDLMFTTDFLDSSMINGNNFEAIGSSFLFFSLFPEQQQIGPDLQLSGSNYSLFGELFNKIYLEYKMRDKGYTNIIRAYVIELVVRIFRKMDSQPNNKIPPRQLQIVNTALQYLRDNFNKQISMDELSAKVFLSKDYFGRLFRDVTGNPVSSLLQQIRIDEACKLLSTTDHKISQIAECCGFNDIKFFYNTFKKTTGLTPGEYRKSAETVSRQLSD